MIQGRKRRNHVRIVVLRAAEMEMRVREQRRTEAVIQTRLLRAAAA